MTGLPLLLDLTGRDVLVVGAGRLGTRRAAALDAAGARVTVVAPQVSAEVDALPVDVRRRAFVDADLDGVWLAYACTDDPVVNAAIAADAGRRRVFCVRGDQAAGGTARSMALARRDDLTVAIHGGDDPRRAQTLRDAIGLALDLGELPTRPHRPVAPGSVAPGSVTTGSVTTGSVTPGWVALVGGGPGDPELITVRGRRLVAEADVVVVDRLAPRELLAGLDDAVEVIDCGKAAHRHNLSQQEINDVLIARARAGRRVVRLKGGDPFVFGRGGEEWLACVAAGVAVSVVPGISSALAAPAAAGIPLTHRGIAAEFTVVSAHADPGGPGDRTAAWADVVRSGGTLVLLMAMDRLAAIVERLVGQGLPESTPAAVVHRATRPEAREVRAPLGQLATEVAAAGVGAPAVVVIGAVVDALRTADVGTGCYDFEHGDE